MYINNRILKSFSGWTMCRPNFPRQMDNEWIVLGEALRSLQKGKKSNRKNIIMIFEIATLLLFVYCNCTSLPL